MSWGKAAVRSQINRQGLVDSRADARICRSGATLTPETIWISSISQSSASIAVSILRTVAFNFKWALAHIW